eukprot:12893443-Prorocentrum_lima.AAC.1
MSGQLARGGHLLAEHVFQGVRSQIIAESLSGACGCSARYAFVVCASLVRCLGSAPGQRQRVAVCGVIPRVVAACIGTLH